MAIIASAKPNHFDPVSQGVHTAVCTAVIDIGEQYNATFNNISRKVLLTWEITDETIWIEGEERPRFISKEYTMSLSEKANLRRDLESWRGKKFSENELVGFDLINILGKGCQIQVIHNDKGYANIAGIMSLPKGMPYPEHHSNTIYFDLTDPECLSLMDQIPVWVQDKIRASSTYEQLTAHREEPDHSSLDAEDDLPF